MGEIGIRRGPFPWVLLVLLLAVAACGRSRDGALGIVTGDSVGAVDLGDLAQRRSEAPVLVRFVGPAQYRADFELLAERFHSQEPGIRVQVLSIAEVLGGRGGLSGFSDIARVLAESADVLLFQMDSSLPESGLVMDLSPWLSGSAGMDRGDFFPHVEEVARAGGSQWAVPAYSLIYPLYFDREILAKAAVPFPHAGWTREDFLALTQSLTEVKEGAVVQYGFVDYGGTARVAWIPGLDSAQDADPTVWPTGSMTDAIAWYGALAQGHRVMPVPGSGEAGIQRDWGLIVSQRAALWSDAFANFPYHEQLRPVGIAPVPASEGPAKMPAIVNGYMISAGSQWPGESWQWIRFLHNQFISFARPSAATPGALPARRSVAEATGYWDQFRPDVARVLRHAAEHLAVMSTGSRKSLLVNEAIKAALGDSAPAVAVANAQAAWEAYRAQISGATPMPVSMVAVSPGQSDRQTIAFAPPPGSDVAAYRRIADAFNQDQEAWSMQVVPPAQSHRADCFVDLRPASDPGAREGILNLGPLLAADDDLALEDFQGQLLAPFQDGGHLWGLPLQAKAYVLFYNPRLFREANLPYPQPGWSMDEFLAYAQTLTAGEGASKRYGFVSLAGDGVGLEVFLALRDAWPWDEAGQPRFHAPEVVDGVRWYTNLALQHGVSPTFPQDLVTPDPNAQATRLALVREGRVAMWGDFLGLERNEAGLEEVQAVLPPQGKHRSTKFVPEGFFIRSNTDYPQACWTWFKAIVTQPSLAQGLAGRRGLDMAAEGEASWASVVADLQSYADLPQLAGSQLIDQRAILFQAVANIYQGMAPTAALTRAQEQLVGGE